MTDATPATAAPAAETPAAPAENFALKVFAGNLAFATTEEELKTIFSEAGTVTNAQIITRGTRSLGYGFVTFSTEAEAQKAIQTLDKKEVAGRVLSVEGAKPQTATEAAEKKPKSKSKKNKARTGEAAARRPRTDEGEEGGAESSAANGAEGKDKSDGPSKSARRRQKKREAKARADGTENGTPEANGASTDAAKAKAPKPKRQPKGPPKGEPSKTLVFVANLAFETTDEKLKEAFSDFRVQSANVVKRNGSSRSKGFGFVDFADETEQKKAIESAQGREIDGRPVSLKVALQEDKSTEAAAEASPATAVKTESS